MREHNINLTDLEIQVILQMISFGQIEITKQMKRLNETDFDIKEYYWHYRYNSNLIKDKLKDIRGY